MLTQDTSAGARRQPTPRLHVPGAAIMLNYTIRITGAAPGRRWMARAGPFGLPCLPCLTGAPPNCPSSSRGLGFSGTCPTTPRGDLVSAPRAGYRRQQAIEPDLGGAEAGKRPPTGVDPARGRSPQNHNHQGAPGVVAGQKPRPRAAKNPP